MQKIFAAAIFIFSAFQIGFAQLNNDEIGDLRKRIKLSDKDLVRINEDANLNSGKPLKIYLAIERRGSERKYFEKWVKEWNKKDGAQYGMLEQVSDISQADIVLAQFIKEEVKRVGETSVSVRTIPLPGQPNSNEPRVKSRVGYNSLILPVYSYLLKREDNLWTILYGEVETSIPGEQLKNPEIDLWNAYKNKRKEL